MTAYAIPGSVFEGLVETLGKAKADLLANALEQGIGDMQAQMRRDTEALRADLKEQAFTKVDGAALKTEIAHLRKDLADSMRQQTNWLTGLILASIASALAIAKLIA